MSVKKEEAEIEQTEDITFLDFPVVGIGASAGGLEALQEFFTNMPDSPGAAFIIIQHLSPDYKSLMDELLARYTKMAIHKVEDGVKIQKNHIYLIPPRMNMTIFHGKLLLSEHSITRTLNLPIDIFFRSLAKDQKKNAIAIILSGTGSDGTSGIRSIKEFGGMAMVQDDQSAKFDGMPRSSIATGLADYILPPPRLAEELVNYVKHPFVSKKQQVEKIISQDESHLAKIISILRDSKGIDFSNYKEGTIIRRIEKRISINRFDTIDQYVDYLYHNVHEANVLFNELLIGVTRFFRDEESFNRLRAKVIPKLFADNNKQEIRIWVAGCSTGEEAYSLAILFREYMIEHSINKEIKIFATDLDGKALEVAATGYFPENIQNDVHEDRLNRFFIKRDSGYQVSDIIRSMIIFARHNLLQDPPFSRIDLISCRNLLIYLNNAFQQKVLSLFYVSMTDPGFMFLGSSESLGPMSEGFDTIDSKHKLYQFKEGYQAERHSGFSLTNVRKNSEIKQRLNILPGYKPKSYTVDTVFEEIMNSYVPDSVILDDNFDVLHTINNVGQYFEFPKGQASLNILKLLPTSLNIVAGSLLRKARDQKNQLFFEHSFTNNEEYKSLILSTRKIMDVKNNQKYYILSFIDEDSKFFFSGGDIEQVDINSKYQERLEELEREVQYKSESLQATVEELETANEELQSSNEELIASNEELQSTNEELQSVNEELYTVNSEHIKKIDELTELNTDLDNLLKNTNIGTIFLDKDLTIRKTNRVASELTNILPSDVGRPIYHLSLDIISGNLLHDVNQVIQNLIPVEREIIQKEGQWFLMRILPYRTSDNAVDGIIIIFIDVSTLKNKEKLLNQLSQRLEVSMKMGNMTWWEWEYETNKVETGEAKYTMLGYKKDEIGEGYQAWTKLIHPEDYELSMEAMRGHLSGQKPFYEVEYRIRNKAGEYIWYRDKGGVISRSDGGTPKWIAGVVSDVTAEKTEINELHNAYIDLFLKVKEPVLVIDSNHLVIHVNESFVKELAFKNGWLEDKNFDQVFELFNSSQKKVSLDNFEKGRIKLARIDNKDYIIKELIITDIKHQGRTNKVLLFK